MNICYWSIAWGNYRYMLQALVDSYKRAGLPYDFHIYTDGPFKDAFAHQLDPAIKLDSRQFFKFHYLKQVLKPLGYDAYVFVDADHYFVRKPPRTPEDLLAGGPWHSFLESPLVSGPQGRKDWWGCPVQQMAHLMRSQGVLARDIRNSNGGYWVCHREFIDDAVRFALEFAGNCERAGWTFQEEVSVAYLGHYMKGDTTRHHLEKHLDYWGTDWTAQYADRLPDGKPWESTSYMSYKKELVNPAIVHAMRSKKALEARGREILGEPAGTQPPAPMPFDPGPAQDYNTGLTFIKFTDSDKE